MPIASRPFLPSLRPAGLAAASLPRLGRLAGALVIAAGSWLLAGLIWDFPIAAGTPPIADETSAADAAERLAGHPLFAQAAPAARSATAALDLTLVGVAASADSARARAVIRRAGQALPLVVAVGDEVAPGLRLRRIARDQVELAGPAGESRLALPQPQLPRQEPHD